MHDSPSVSCRVRRAVSTAVPRRTGLLATALSLLALAPLAPAAGIGDGAADELRAARRLRERAATLRQPAGPLRAPDQQVGQIAVMEHDGSDYSRSEPDGTPNYAPRAALAQRFYQTHGDFYDFLVVFTNFEFETGQALAFHNLVRNDVAGIGKPIVDNGPLFGSPGRLRGYVDMAALDRYGRNALATRPGVPLSTQPGEPGFRDTLNVVAHEVAHQWLAFVRYRDGSGAASTDLLGRDGGHWSYLLDSDASVMYGADWAAQPAGGYRAERVLEGYSALDRYLMGFLDPSRVAPLSLLRAPGVDPTGLPVEGDVVQATPESVALSQVIAAEGQRTPGFLAAPKTFRLGFVLLTAPGTTASPEDLAAVERVRDAFAAHFFELTQGVAVADTTLAETPPGPPAPAPDLDLALQWLLGRQLDDGRWQDAAGSAVRDTTAALDALRDAGLAGAPYDGGLGWLRSAAAANVDFAARRGLTLATTLAPGERQALAQELLAWQNRDGGFGAGPGYQSDPLDTALAARALAALGWPGDVKVTRALVYLRATRQADGGWPAVPGGESSTVTTAQGLLALQDWADHPVVQPLLGPALAALLARRNADGGFGDGPSTPYAGALALRGLLRGGAPSAAVDATVAWLQGAQLEDGSWGESPYQTALVLAALKGGVTPNLVVPPDSLVLTPPAPREGQVVRVGALVRNTGRRPAAPSRARLYDGDPADPAHAVADVPVGELQPGQEAAVAFDYPTQDRAGQHTLYVVADADREVAEAREDDNAAARALTVSGRLPDLVLRTGDLDVLPYPPQDGETVEVRVAVHNQGQRGAAPGLVRVYRGNPRLGGTVLGSAPLPGLAQGASAVVSLAWDTTGAQGSHELFAVADPDYALDELDETNNETSLPVTVTGPVPPDPDLEVARLALEPPVQTSIPQALGVRVLVRNLGREAVASSVRLSDDRSAPYGDLPVSLGPRSATTLVFSVSLASGGDRTFSAVADPDGTLPEPDEGNNQASATLDDPGSTFDLELLAGEVTPSSTDLTVGETLTVTALVHNRGTAPVNGLPLLLVHALPTPVELGRAFVDIAPGGVTSAALSWNAGLVGDPLPLAVVADPFDLLPELSEANNRVDFAVTVSASDLPNLATSGADVQFVPDPPLEGAPALVRALVRNTGVVAAGPFAVEFWRGDPDQGGLLIGTAALAGLEPGAQAAPEVTWATVDVRGAQGLFVRVDPAGQVQEFDEGDNVGFRPFTSLGLPDLVLTAGDVSLEPGYPRAGEPVTVRARVRNLGLQPSAAATLRAFEGETNGGSTVAEVPLPALPPGELALLSFTWTPAAPAGERPLALVVDADDVVREQDEGNNRARRAVVVQDANLYLTEPYFSPDGDGAKDETSLAWRAAGTPSVSVVVSSSRGKALRSLVADGPAEGSATWDGRDVAGRLMWDGRYTFTLKASNGAVLGRREVLLDTNRSPIHDAAGTGLLAVRNLTCALPQLEHGPVFTPAGDEALFILHYDDAASGLHAGLLRVAADGQSSYVGAADPWYQDASFPFNDYSSRPFAPVARLASPDGREVLVRRNGGELWAVDLVDGARRLVTSSFYGDSAAWSPDGSKILVRDRVLLRDGSQYGSLTGCCGEWSWSPDGQFLAQGNDVYTAAGEFVKSIPFEGGFGEWSTNEWRGDGLIFLDTGGGGGGDGSSNGGTSFFLLDPETEQSQALSWLSAADNDSSVYNFDWSPDGGKIAYSAWDYLNGTEYTRVTREDGRFTRLLATQRVTPSAGDTVGSFETQAEGQVCNGWSETYALFNLQNLTADLQVSRLPANNGLVLRGTASDAWLDHYQLEYALESAPEAWHPIGAASDLPVINDDFGVWVPAAPGRYVVRLTVTDRAGNQRARARVVSWALAPAIVNISQSELLISPNGDGRKDSLRFDYLVQERTRLEVRVAGPLRPGLPAPVLRRFSFEYPDLGPASFVWDGRDASGQVVPDGRYTVFLNELPFRVEVDTTPPDQAWSESAPTLKTEVVGNSTRVFIGLTRSMHVVDAHLKAWTAPEGEGTEQVYDPERDTAGNIVYDERGVPRIRFVDGHAADLVEEVEIAGNVERLAFTAEDRAGNVSQVAEPARPEALFLFEAREQDRTQRLLPPRAAGQLHEIRPPQAKFFLGTTALEPSSPVFFRFQRETGGSWSELPASLAWQVVFEDAGLALGVIYRGEFVQRLPGREIRTDTFRFRVCEAAGEISFEENPVAPGVVSYHTRVSASVGEPITNVKLLVEGSGRHSGLRHETPMGLVGDAYLADVLGPVVSCAEPDDRLQFSARITGASGRVYSGNLGCLRLSLIVPVCPNRLKLAQVFRGCQQTPDDVYLAVKAESEASDARVLVERGPEDAPQLLAELRPPVDTTLHVGVAGEPQGGFPVRARLQRASQPAPLASRAIEARIDRTPPEALVLEPVEGGTQCVARDPQTGAERLRLTLEVEDGSNDVELGPGRWRFEEDPWSTLLLDGTPSCSPSSGDPRQCLRLPVGEPFERTWNVSGLPSGHYTLDQAFCDGSGNRVSEVRRFTMSKQPPYLTLDSISRRIFSPNGDGRAEDTVVTLGLAQALRLTVEVRRGAPDGTLVARLVHDQTHFAGHHPFTWDGRDASGVAQPDGDYYLVASGLDGCSNVGRVWALLTVDVTPPTALIAQPADAQHVSTSVDVRGRALDAHFAQYELAFGEGLSPADWNVIRVGGGPVGQPPWPVGALGTWTPPTVPGPDPVFYTLRLVAADVAENSTETRVTVTVGPRLYLDHLTAEPAVFSPNGDGRRETLALEYQILLPGRVTLQVRTLGGAPLRTFESGADRPAGTYVFLWDGLEDDGGAAPEGDLQAVVRVEDPSGGPTFQEQSALFALDRTPPALELLEPAEGAFVDRTSPVRGSVDDPRLVRWRVSAADASGTLFVLGEGTEPRQATFLAALDLLADGPYTLVVAAEDEAENAGSQGLSFTVDSIAPEAGLDLRPLQVLRRGTDPIAVRGRATDLNFAEYVLSFGAGETPAVFVEIARGVTAGHGLTLGQWQVSGVPDGLYTLRLTATDKAGHGTEARETVVLDGTPPVALIRVPLEGGYVTAETGIEGDASDANLLSWRLETAPGPASQAYQWALLAEGDEVVEAGLLALWAPLPADGLHTLRLTVEDEAGFSSVALRTVTVDTTPPAPPTGLAAEVLRHGATGDVRLTWNANSEPDLAGYLVYRDGEELTPAPIPSPLHLDSARPDGTYRYEVTAVDRAGNESAPAPLPVRVDLTPPLVDIQRPQAGARLSGSVDVRGTAFSPDDFAEYRLSVGAGPEPAAFTLLRRSTLPVGGGVLGTWTAVGDGPFTLLLEAEDNSGNQASTRVTVEVDNDAPGPPVLVSVVNLPDPEALTSTWTPSASTDVDGYLLERNGQVANAPGVVVGDLRPYLLPGPSYVDAGLPDGEHCYRVTAMDSAGNLSAPSNQICQSLDNHPPHVVLLEPLDGLRFDYPLSLLGFTLDRDVTSVVFQYKASASATWLDVGPADTQVPFEIVFDPLPLSFGDYDLRAVATDAHGNLDPAPEAITVTYGDATAPARPHDLLARVDAYEVRLTWTANGEADLAGYNVYRDGERLTATPQSAAVYVDAVEPGAYHYAVTAVDEDGNESAPASDDAVVYQVQLEQPYPVTEALEATLSGDGARPETTVEVQRDGTPVATVAVAEGPTFQVPAVPLLVGPNLLVARGADAPGNLSIPSGEVVLISNQPPPPVTDLAGTVSGHTVDLAWSPVLDPELAGYVVRRDGQRLTPGLPQTDFSAISASSTYPFGSFGAPLAFDGNPDTWWIPDAPTSTWTVTFPAPVLVEKVALRFASIGAFATAERYRVEVLWEGRYLPLVRASGNEAQSVEHVFPAPFQTTGLRVALETGPYLGLAEVQVTRLDVVPAGTSAWQDAPVPDGTHAYAVTAIDRYGFEGLPGTASVPVGDTTPPGRPTGLIAVVELSDVQLTWDPGPEPDLDHYVVLRDGARIGTSPVPAFRDASRPNGTYVYAVVAVDLEGLESEASDPATAVVERTTPPAAPVILVPTDAAHPITIGVPQTPVRGRSDPGTLVSLEVNGVTAGWVPSSPAFTETGTWAVPPEAATSVVALAPDGLHLAYTRYAWELGQYRLFLRHLGNGEESALGPGTLEFPEALEFSRDGRKLAYRVSGALRVLSLADGAVADLDVSPGTGGQVALSADGSQAAFVASYFSAGWRYSLRVRDLATGVQRQLALGTSYYYRLAWSPLGNRLAVVVLDTSTFRRELRLVDVASGAQTLVSAEAWTEAPPAWSHDGAQLAYTRYVGGVERVSLYSLASASSSDVTDGSPAAWDARFDLEGTWLTFLRESGPGPLGLRAELVARRAGGEQRVAASIDTDWRGPLSVHAWTQGGYLHAARYQASREISILPGFDGAFGFASVALAPGANTLVAQAIEPLNGLASPDSEPVQVTVSQDAFPDLEVTAADVQSYPSAPVVGQTANLSVRVRNVGAADARDVPVALELLDAQGGVILERSAQVSQLGAGESALVTAFWAPALAGSYLLRGSADGGNFIVESREDNNLAERPVQVSPEGGGALTATLTSDRELYPAHTLALLQGQVWNGGAPFSGHARLTLEARDGTEMGVLDERPVALQYGASLSLAVQWNTAATYAGDYRFALRVFAAGAAAPAAMATRDFAVLPDVRLAARLAPERASVPLGQEAAFAGRVDNIGANAPLEGLRASFRILPAAGGAPVFASEAVLPRLLPGAQWPLALAWTPAQPAGAYVARLEVRPAAPGDSLLAVAEAPFAVAAAPAVALAGSLRLVPADVLTGQASAAEASVTNRGSAPLVAHPFTVDVTTGANPGVLVQAAFSLDLEPGQTRTLTLPLDTSLLPPGFNPAFLRSAAPAQTLARARLHVHGLIAPPSLDAPPEGARVATPHPTLSVNNASTAEGAPLAYEFELYADPPLQVPLPGAAGLPETPQRTAWTVDTNLAEDHTYYWRARATDGFSSSPWMAVASFTVDTVDLPPTAPRVDWPAPGSRVATTDVTLVVRNGEDPERAPLTYEFLLATDQSLSNVVAAASGLAEGPGLTGWHVPLLLAEDATFYWTARASDGPNQSPWAEVAAFTVDAVNLPPTAPTPLAPVGGAAVATLDPELRLANASDAEQELLTYVFQVDRSPAFASPDLQVSPEIPETPAETAWTPAPLLDNTLWYWRASASDGHGQGPWAGSSFFVNLANDPPGAPVPLNPPDGGVVATPSPELRVRNAVDLDRDPLTYEFEVRDASGAVAAAVPGVAEGQAETAWAVAPALVENQTYTWSARAHDGQVAGAWSSAWSFRVNAVPDPPTAPSLIAPAEGSVVGLRRPELVVANATSPEGLALTYTFELYLVVNGVPALFDQLDGVPEGAASTSFTPTLDLPDGDYSWRARAVDANQAGPWMPSARFSVAVDVPPGAPTGLSTAPGNARVTLAWDANPEPDVAGYRVYRSLTAGGPYAPIADVPAPGYLDTGLTNGVTYRYVVTALDAHLESPFSNEAAATPQGGGPLPAEVRFRPDTVKGECLLGCTCDDDDSPWDDCECDDDRPGGAAPEHEQCEDRPTRLVRALQAPAETDSARLASVESSGGGCPLVIKATIELPAGHDPAAILRAGVRLNGLVAPDPSYWRIVDLDQDGLPELELAFEFRALAALLHVGDNLLGLSGSVAGQPFSGQAVLRVLAPRVTLFMSPRTLKLSSNGQTVQARLSLEGCGSNADFDLASLRLNETVPIERVVSRPGRHDLIVKFNRAAVAAVLSPGPRVEVRVSGLVRGLPFVAVDYIKVLP